ncbi:MAG TPA: hypothetical protein VFN36_04775 [Solirubrobacteraceae bacterium]|nr:hypothetical protein [Solirubrobacteraceae bacterium]
MTRSLSPLTDRDHAVLGPLAEHRFLTLPQIALLLAVGERTALRRLRGLERSGLVTVRPVFHGVPQAAWIERPGLRALDSPLAAPQINLNEYRHDVGVGWLWLAARAGALGELRDVTTERRMQAEDAAAGVAGEPPAWGIGVGLFSSRGTPQRHYPDLLLQAASGHRVAVELELTGKSAGRLDRIMRAYASDARVDHVLYVAATPVIAARVRESARRAGIPERVHVQMLARDGIAGARIGRTPAGRTTVAARARGTLPARPQGGPAR